MGSRPGLLGMLGAALALAALSAVLVGAQHPLSPQGVEQVLARRVVAHLAKDPRDLSFAAVEMRGQTAVLRGVAPSAALRRAAEEAALGAAGPGGPWRGGVADVDNRLTVSPQPYSGAGWEAVYSGTGVRLSGETPSAQIQAAVARRLALLLGDPGRLQDETLIGPAAEGAWEAVVLDGLHQLARLDHGTLRVTGKRVFLLGVGPEDAAAKARQWGRERLPAGYSARVDVAARTEAEAAAFNASAAVCSAMLASALTPPRAWFAGGAAAPAALGALATAARRCAHHALIVEAPGATPQERRARGLAVVQFLLGEGVRPDALRVGEAAGAALRVRAVQEGERDRR